MTNKGQILLPLAQGKCQIPLPFAQGKCQILLHLAQGKCQVSLLGVSTQEEPPARSCPRTMWVLGQQVMGCPSVCRPVPLGSACRPMGASWMGCHLQGRTTRFSRGQALQGFTLAAAERGAEPLAVPPPHARISFRCSCFAAHLCPEIGSCQRFARCISHRRMIIGDCDVTR